MVTQTGVGESILQDSFEAGAEAAKKAMEQAALEECDFVLAFGTIGYSQQELLKGIQSITGKAPLSGGSTEGIIARTGPNETAYAVAVMVIKSEELKFYNILEKDVDKDSKKAGEKIAEQLKDVENKMVLLVFPEGYTVNVQDIFDGLESGLGKMPVFGGLTGEDFSHGRTFQYHNGEVFEKSIAAVLISGSAKICIRVNHGCIPLGVEQIITKVEGNKIYEIDGRNAYEVFVEYIPEENKTDYRKATTALCLGFATPPDVQSLGYPAHFIRYVAEINKEEGYIAIQSTIKEGTPVYFMYRDTEKMTAGVEKLAQEIKGEIGEAKPKMVFQFSCAGRGKLMFNPQTQKEIIKITQDVFAPDVPIIGHYCFGEIAPLGNKNYFHNYTIVVCVVY